MYAYTKKKKIVSFPFKFLRMYKKILLITQFKKFLIEIESILTTFLKHRNFILDKYNHFHD